MAATISSQPAKCGLLDFPTPTARTFNPSRNEGVTPNSEHATANE